MTKPIYANTEHEVIVESYIAMIKEFVKDLSNETRYNNFLEVLEWRANTFLVMLLVH